MRRAEVIGPLAAAGVAGEGPVTSAALQLGVSRRQVYVLLRRWREGHGVVTDLIPGRSRGGRGGQRLSPDVEEVVREVWIALRDRLARFVIRRDPRDISRIWVLDPDGGSYLPVPYLTLSHPAVSVWEHRAAVERLREQGRAQVDEDALFRMVEQMRGIADTAAATTRKARRDAERHSRIGGVRAVRPAATLSAPDDITADDVGDGRAADGGAAVPFEVIEQW